MLYFILAPKKNMFTTQKFCKKFRFSHKGSTDITSLKTTGIEKSASQWSGLTALKLPTCCYYFPSPPPSPHLCKTFNKTNNQNKVS